MTRRRMFAWVGAALALIVAVVAFVWMDGRSVPVSTVEELSIEKPSAWRLPWMPEAWVVAREPDGGVRWRTRIERLGAEEIVAEPQLAIVFTVESGRRVTRALDRSSGAEVWRATQSSGRDLTTYGNVTGLIFEDALIEVHSRPSFVRVLGLRDGVVRESVDLEGDGTAHVVRGPTGVLVFGKLTDGPSDIYLVDSGGRLTPAGMPNAATSCATTNGVLSLDSGGWLYERGWGAPDWSRRVEIGRGELNGCVSNGDWTVIAWQPRDSDAPGDASPQTFVEEELPLSRGSALLALPGQGEARGVAFGTGLLLLPELEAHMNARGALPELDEALRVEWTPPFGEHDDRHATTRRYRYDVRSNTLSPIGGSMSPRRGVGS